jgi:acyl-CoA synthetase (AMP-forming)/AMP-acid ligase II
VNIAQLLSERVATCGDRVAIIDNSRGATRTFTFAQLELAASRMAAQLHDGGLRRGDPIVLLQPVSAELYIIFTALLRSGLVAVFIDPSAGREHVDRCCTTHPPRAFIGCAHAHLLRFISPALRHIPLKFSTDFPVPGARRLNHRNEAAARSVIENCSADSPAIIRFTSGSTGQPKASVRSHGFLLAQQRVLERSFALCVGELDLVTMPMFVLSNLAAGVTSLIPQADLKAPGSIYPASLLRQILTHRPDRIGAAPALLENLADYCLETFRVPSSEFRVRKIFTGGAPVFPRLLDKLGAVAPEADIVAVYGSTEAEPIALLNHRDISSADRDSMANGRGLLAGFPDEAIQVRILREDGGPFRGRLTNEEFQSAGSPPGKPGQVVVAGPHVQPVYLNDEADQETKLQDNRTVWHQTGDAGYIDDRGRLWLLGRCGARISDTHGTLYPFQVECIAYENPMVRRAALLSHENRRVLALEAKSEFDVAEMKSRLNWAFIDTVKVLPRIPVDKRHNSKIDYPTLQSIFRGS